MISPSDLNMNTTTLNSGTTRNIGTLGFFILTGLIGFVGSYSLKVRNQQRLLREENGEVSLNRLSPWLSESETLTYICKTRRLPGGRYGLLMLFTGAFSLASHLFVGRYVYSAQLPGRCVFHDGLIVPSSSNSSLEVEPIYHPAYAWPATDVAQFAQQTSYYNKGPLGVYRYVPEFDAYFSATNDDVLGSWNCRQAASKSYPTTLGDSKVLSELQSNGLLYDDSVMGYDGMGQAGNDTGFFVWTPSKITTTEDSGSPWNVKAAVLTNVYDEMDAISTRNVTGYQCTLDTHLAFIANNINTTWAFQQWTERTHGSILYQSNDVGLIGDAIAMSLNTMIMVAGAHNQFQNVSTERPIKLPTYGCLQPTTVISAEVFIMAAFLSLILLTLATIGIYHSLRIRPLRRARRQIDLLPSDLTSWQAAVLKGPSSSKSVKSKDLRKYVLGWGRGGVSGSEHILEFRKKGDYNVRH